MGTTTFYAFASTRPEYNSKILVHVGIAPVAMLSHTTSAFKLLIPFAKQIEVISYIYLFLMLQPCRCFMFNSEDDLVI